MRGGLNSRLVAGSIALVVLIAGAFGVTLASVDRLHDLNRELQRSVARISAADRLEQIAIDAETGQRGFILTGQERFLEPYEAARRALPTAEADLVAGLPAADPRRALGRGAVAQIEEYVTEYVAEQVQRARQDPAAARDVVASGAGKRRVDALRAQFARLERAERAQAAAIRADSDDAADRAILFALLGLIGAPLLIALYASYLSRLVVAPIRRVAEAARRRGAGELDARADERGGAEAGVLARSFNLMADAAQHSRDELESQNAELEAQQGELERTLDALAEETERSDSFHRVVAQISSAVDLDGVATVLLGALGDALEADAAMLYAIDAADPDGPLALAGARGFERDRLAPRLAPGAGLAGRALDERRVVRADHGQAGIAIPAFGAEAVARHELHVPLLGPTRVAGVVSFVRVGEAPFAERAVELVRRLAEPAAVGLTRALTYQYAQHQAELAEAVVETAQDAFVATGADLTVLQWSPQAEALYGWSAKEAVGRSILELVVPETDRSAFERRHAVLLAQGRAGAASAHRFEVTARHKDGRELLVELSLVPVRIGGRWRVNAFVRDIAGRKLREREREARGAVSRVLAEVEGRAELIEPVLAALARALDWPLVTFWVPRGDGELRCAGLWHQPGAEGLEPLAHQLRTGTATSGAGLIGRAWEGCEPVWMRVTGERSVRAGAAAAAGLKIAAAVPIGRDEHALGVLEFWQRDGSPPDAELFETLDAIAGLVTHVTERRSAEEEADRLKNEFFALVSHELRTPLTSIVGYLELVLEGEAGDVSDQQERFLGIVDRNARRLQRLVGDLLFVAQVEAGTLSLDAGRAMLDTIVVNAVEAARPRAEQAGVEVVADAHPVPEIEGDADRLGQLVDNLVGNALKFTPAGGRVTVSLRELGDSAQLAVRDTGIGIPPAEQARLFDRFYRASTAVEQEIPGIGLGLSICQAIAEGHGGRIEVESEVGAGTTFRVTLPLRRRPSPDPQPHDRDRTGAPTP